jgi:hypothetical protein
MVSAPGGARASSARCIATRASASQRSGNTVSASSSLLPVKRETIASMPVLAGG